jgi:carbon-monoxide dehydrogenase medium subunit
MFPRPFDYLAPESLDEVLAALAAEPDDTKVLAGGHSLLPLMKLRLVAPRRLVDLRRLRGTLAYVRPEDGGLAIGALTTYTALETDPLVTARYPMLAEAAGAIADLQVRNCGTIGGSLAHADPAGDLPAVVLALDATLEVVSRQGTRRLPISEFFVDAYTTALAPGELLTAVHLPAPAPRSGAAYTKFRHPASGYAVVGVAAVLALDAAGQVATARVAITGVGEKPYRAQATEAALAGASPTAEALRAAAAHAVDGVAPLEDLFASAEYRAHLTRVYAERALARALARAQAA